MRVDGFNKKTGIFIITYHVLLVIAWCLYFPFFTPSLGMVGISVALYFLTGLSITAGYHRYYAHTTYKTNPIVEAILLFFASASAEGSALRWSFEHRLHHAFVDTDRDPYSVKKGFWYAHILWLFKKPAPIDNKVVADLVKNPLVMFQHKYYIYCMVGSNLILFGLVGLLLQDFLGAFVISWWTRLFFLHHSTWFINSLAHTWGAQTFSKEQSAVDNYIISLLTFGEGYHNYHHTFANDYRNGIRWYHFDPTKWLIWGLHRFGWAHSLKRVNHYHIQEKLIMAAIDERLALLSSKKDEVVMGVDKLRNEIVAKFHQVKPLVEQYVNYKKTKTASKELLRDLRSQIRELNRGIRSDWKMCRQLIVRSS